MIIQFTAPLLDHSGYGEASRNTLMAMHSVGIKVTTKIASFTPDKLNVGFAGDLAIRLEKNYKNYDINLIELTPEHFPFFREKNKYNIGYFFWEVKGVDPQWIKWCNLMDEIWLPSPYFAKMFRDAGVKVPVNVVPCCMDMKLESYKPYILPVAEKPKVIFYSIFQWTERKNPKALIESYWKEFAGCEDVVLIIKTYRSNFTESEKQAVKDQITEWKEKTKLKHYPKIWLVLEDMSYDEIMRLHATGDFLISTHRGEGWGYSQMVAMAMGKYITSTNFGGIHEYIPSDFASLLDYKLINLWGMGHIPWYNKNQQWADINQKELMKILRDIYNNKSNYQRKASLGKRFVRRKFNFKAVGMEIKKILETVRSKNGRGS